MAFPKYGVNIIFDDDSIYFLEEPLNQYKNYSGSLINLLVLFITYKTFVNYMIWTPKQIRQEEIDIIPEVENVHLSMIKYAEQQREEKGKTYIWQKIVPFDMVVEKNTIKDFLNIYDQVLLYAIYFYLKGTYTQEYFLIEFYKCLEIVKKKFKEEPLMVRELNPYGFSKSCYKELRKYANDSMNPISIGRHAPDITAIVHPINTKWLFDDKKGKEVFELGQNACRITIEAYIKYLLAKKYNRGGQ